MSVDNDKGMTMEVGNASPGDSSQRLQVADSRDETNTNQDASTSTSVSSSTGEFFEKLTADLLMKIASLALRRDDVKTWGTPMLNVGDIRCLSKAFRNTCAELVPRYLVMQNVIHDGYEFEPEKCIDEVNWHPALTEILESTSQPSTSWPSDKLKARLSQIKWITTNRQRWGENVWQRFLHWQNLTPEAYVQRLHQLAEKIQAGWFSRLEELYLYTLNTEDLIKFLNIAFPTTSKASDVATTASTSTSIPTQATASVILKKLDFRTDNWNPALLARLKILVEQFPDLRFGNGLGMHEIFAKSDNELLNLENHTDYAFWDGNTISIELRDEILQWMKSTPKSPLDQQAKNMTADRDDKTDKSLKQYDYFIDLMKRGRRSDITTADDKPLDQAA